MKRAIYSVLAVVVLAGLVGCKAQPTRTGGCDPCGTSATCSTDARGQAAACCESDGDPCERCCDPGRVRRCRECGGRGCRACREKCCEEACQGPATGAITYPYYTIRGPRDFLAKNPPRIGP